MTVHQASQADDRPVRKMNVLLVASSLWIGGAETVIRHLAEGIDRQRFKVSVCYLKEKGQIGAEIERAGLDIVGVDLAARNRVDYLTSLKLRRVIRSRGIDVVHTHTTHGLVDGAVCRLLERRLRLVHTFHFGNYPNTKRRVLWMERVFGRVADRLVAVGESQRSQILRVHGFRESRVGVIHNGVAPRQPGEGAVGFRAALNAGDRPIVGTVATLIPQKGLQDFIRLAALLRDRGCMALFVIVGEGRLRAELEELRRVHRLEESLVFTGWVTNAAEDAIPAFDVFVQPSLWEAMSVVVLEAMSAGCAVVATDVGENGHVISNDVDGILVRPGDVWAMSKAVERLLRDVGERERLATSARRKVATTFTTAAMTRAYEDLYRDVAKIGA